jgi:hypothetical protein
MDSEFNFQDQVRNFDDQLESYVPLTLDGLAGSVLAAALSQGDGATQLMTGLSTLLVHQLAHFAIAPRDQSNPIRDIDLMLPDMIPFDGILGTLTAWQMGGVPSAIGFAVAHGVLHRIVQPKFNGSMPTGNQNKNLV